MYVLHHFEDFRGFIGKRPYRGPAEMFFCPGCRYGHWFGTGTGAPWTWNGDREKPTVQPSILQTVTKAEGGKRCHLFIENGQIRFLSDCEHELAGKIVPLELF